jgi:DNA-binding NarL/FixJ family response regulator
LKLLIVESNGLFRETFVRAFRAADGVDVVGEIDHVDLGSLAAEVRELEPDVVVIGVGVADADILSAVNEITMGEGNVGVVLHGRSLTLPAALEVTEILRSSDRGFAYLDSDRIESVDGLISVIRVVDEGKVVIDPQTTRHLLGLIDKQAQTLKEFDHSELHMLRAMARGETDDAIAADLGMDLWMVSAAVVDLAGRLGVDAVSRDARVTTILRYLVATGELPMDYDTGTHADPVAASSALRVPTAEDDEPEPLPLADIELDELIRSAGPWVNDAAIDDDLGAFAMPGAPEVPERSETPEARETRDSSDHWSVQVEPTEIIIDVVPEVVAEQDEAADPVVERVSAGRKDAGFGGGQEGVQEFTEFARLAGSEDAEVALAILEWASGHGLRVRWSVRSSDVSYAIVLEVGSLPFWLLTVWASGNIDVQFAMMLAQPPLSDIERRRDFANRLNLIRGVRVEEADLRGRPRIALASIREEESWSMFTAAMDGLLTEIRTFLQPARQRPEATS